MFQLERLRVAKETLVQIVNEMYDGTVETTEGMIGSAVMIEAVAQDIQKLVKEAKERTDEDS